jgi:tRNA threonylcarbamoyl adenosine modification protein (Sua5/YciO/YrdC/YwlC family)
MLTRLYSKNNNPQELQALVDLLNDGGVFIFPTDTVYALGCHGLKERAIERICRFKNIDPRKHRFSVICTGLSMVSEYAKVSNDTFKLLKRNLPGPFTFILQAGNSLPRIFKQRKEVGIRIPDASIIHEIAVLLDAPILTTSLPYDSDDEIEYTTTPELIDEKWGDAVDVIIDGGIGGTAHSTVVDCTGEVPEIVRQGKGILNN